MGLPDAPVDAAAAGGPVAASPLRSSTWWFAMLMLASVGMVLLNKGVMYAFPYPMLILLFQNIATVLLNMAGAWWLNLFEMKRWQLAEMVPFIVPAITFTFLLISSMRALPLVAVATVVVFRNISTLVVAVGDVVLFKKRFSRRAVAALLVILIGSLIYAYADGNYNPVGYRWIALNTLLNAIGNLYEKFVVSASSQVRAEPNGASAIPSRSAHTPVGRSLADRCRMLLLRQSLYLAGPACGRVDHA